MWILCFEQSVFPHLKLKFLKRRENGKTPAEEGVGDLVGTFRTASGGIYALHRFSVGILGTLNGVSYLGKKKQKYQGEDGWIDQNGFTLLRGGDFSFLASCLAPISLTD